MKRNYQYLQGELSGGNLSSPSPPQKLPKLDDQAIEKLYKYYTSKDKFHAKFKGTKREYCASVAGLIENFYQKNLKTFKVPNSLSGGVKYEKPGERKLPRSTAELASEVQKFIRIDPTSRILTRAVTNPGKKNVYKLGTEFEPRKEAFMFSNMGATPKGVMGAPAFSTDLTEEEILDHARKYEYFLDNMFNDVAKANFLLCARFTHIIDLTPEGYEERVNFSSALANSRLIGKKKSWTETDEAAFRTEYTAFCETIKKTPEYEDWDPEYTRFFCLQKLFSEEGTYNVFDFAGENINTEFKGNITEGKLQKLFSEGKRKADNTLGASAKISLQVDVKKISEMIFDAISRPGLPKKSNLCIIRYISNSKINRVVINEDGKAPPQRNNLPIESIINFNLNKLFASETWLANKNEFESYARRYNSLTTPRDKTDYVKSEKIDSAVAELVRYYFNEGNTSTKADGTPKEISKTDVYIANKDAKDEEGEPIKLKMFDLNIRNPLISEKLELWSISKNLPTSITSVKALSDFLMSVETDNEAERAYDRFCTIGSPNGYQVNEELIKDDVFVPEPISSSEVPPVDTSETKTSDEAVLESDTKESDPVVVDRREELIKKYKDEDLNIKEARELAVLIGNNSETVKSWKWTDLEKEFERAKLGEDSSSSGAVTVVADDSSKEKESSTLETEEEAERLRKADETSAALTSMTDDELSQRYFPDLDDVGSVRKALKKLLGVDSSSKIRDPVLFDMLRKNPPKD